MTYKIYLREGNDLRLIAETEAELWLYPILGRGWRFSWTEWNIHAK